jgi:hypothetical protein
VGTGKRLFEDSGEQVPLTVAILVTQRGWSSPSPAGGCLEVQPTIDRAIGGCGAKSRRTHPCCGGQFEHVAALPERVRPGVDLAVAGSTRW